MVTQRNDSLEVWWQRQSEKSWSAFTPFLAFLALLYHAAVSLRSLYLGKKGAKRLPGYVVSIGNLSLGGTGKTPAVSMVAEWAFHEGHNVAILSRGYGGQYKEGAYILSNGSEICGTSYEAGDEPYLLAQSLPGVPIILAKDRYLAGMEANKRFGSRFFVLDDGFQHRALGRDLDILLLDGRNPFGNGHLFPWGPLREPIGHAARADIIILTRTEEDSHSMGRIECLEAQFPGKPIFRSDHIPDKLFLSNGAVAKDPRYLHGKKVVAFAGIARPDEFRKTLQKLGARVLLFRAFKDHHPFRIQDMSWLFSESEKLDAHYLLTTEKDWVRLDDETKRRSELGYLTIRFSLLSGEEAFSSFLKKDFQEWNAQGKGAGKRHKESARGSRMV